MHFLFFLAEEDASSKSAKIVPAPNIVGMMPGAVGFAPPATYGVMQRPMCVSQTCSFFNFIFFPIFLFK